MTSLPLSIIIPTLNEADTIVSLIESLKCQKNPPEFEIIVVDGGSRDSTCAQVSRFEEGVQLVSSGPGRAKQMNVGAGVARGEALLFLHADTLIKEPFLLCRAAQEMRVAYDAYGHDRLAGHFGLHFVRSHKDYERAYYFYECKTRLNRPGCINGDQGMWLKRKFFEELGGFDESLSFMEDVRFVSRVFQQGQWLNFSGHLFTSARRFETEGLKERQTLNALLCAMDVIGLEAFFQCARLLYQEQLDTQRLDLKPFLVQIHRLSWAKGFWQGGKWWWATGSYVASNAWQLAFAMDCRHGFAKGLPVDSVKHTYLHRYDRYMKGVVESVIGRSLTTLVTFIWFYSRLFYRSA